MSDTEARCRFPGYTLADLAMHCEELAERVADGISLTDEELALYTQLATEYRRRESLRPQDDPPF